ncbi:hypothetical protein E5608_22975 [Salmonella enterica]|nr:hypothetical protein [Salmonella enterica]EAQ3454933.1 hypothetical protein [Salmonella enterica]
MLPKSYLFAIKGGRGYYYEDSLIFPIIRRRVIQNINWYEREENRIISMSETATLLKLKGQ